MIRLFGLLVVVFVSGLCHAQVGENCDDANMIPVRSQNVAPFCIDVFPSSNMGDYESAEFMCEARGMRLCSEEEWTEGTLRIHDLDLAQPYDGRTEWVYSDGDRVEGARPVCVGFGGPIVGNSPLGNPTCHAGCTAIENRIRCCHELPMYIF